MIQLITGEKGKGKTKYLLDSVNNTVKTVSGNIVYVDKNAKHMYELNNKIRLINLSEFPVKNSNELIYFICGILSQDSDLEYMYLDSFLTLCNIDKDNNDAIIDTLTKLNEISDKFNMTFVVSLSKNLDDIGEIENTKVLVSL